VRHGFDNLNLHLLHSRLINTTELLRFPERPKSMIEAELHVIGGKHSGQVVPLNRRKFLIGRETDCQLRPNSELVSRHHCVFGLDDYSVRLRDLGSTNGTTVNGERIVKEVTLVAGDHVTVGNLDFEFRILNPASASGDETDVSNIETMMEIPSTPPSDTTLAPIAPESAPVVNPATTQQIPVQVSQPPVNGDNNGIAQQHMIPGQPPYQPMMPGQAGFPGQMYGGYPYQPQPQMPMYPQGYPQQQPMPGYPQQQQQPATVAPAEPVTEPAGPAVDVSLPDPSQTGVVDEPPKAAAKADSAGAGDSSDVPADNAAADIIRQYTQRRPG
jgi:pSer/pThr/pTyr-binding forkhead associated (FHA) protein